MNARAMVSMGLGAVGCVAATLAIAAERRMQRHRRPGVSYAQATLRRDGGWKRTDLFTPEGLEHQARAARYGLIATLCWMLAVLVWVVPGSGS